MANLASLIDHTSLARRREFITAAEKLKNGGNEQYRKVLEECKKPPDQRDKTVLDKSLKEAKRQYHQARLQAQAAYPFNPDSFKKEQRGSSGGPSTSTNDENAILQKQCYDLIASIYNNLAAVILASPGPTNDDYGRAAEYCSNVLLIQKDNSKAMYRKAQALEKMGHIRRALTFYRDADLAEDHKNAAIQRDLARLKLQAAEAKKQSKVELKENFQRGMAKGGLSLASDEVQYGKREKKKKGRKRYPESPSRGSSSSPSPSSDSKSSSSGRSSDEE